MPRLPKEKAQQNAYLQNLGQKLLTNLLELRKSSFCPECRQYSLTIDLAGDAVVIMCTTPVRFDLKENALQNCAYTKIIRSTDIAAPPFTLKFSEPSPAPARRRATTSKTPQRTRAAAK